ncbi:DUF3307 domain-containing protein [Serratia sp. NPDC078593]|uniref:DUF3307 domain-containing protein n=1 Tax=unclassified Serratia (in: enterobacteria) TaxID=2647522 RepID=UPI0037CEA304
MDDAYAPLLLWLLVGHLVADFPLQPFSWVQDKTQRRARSRLLLLHALIHGVVAAAVIAVFSGLHGAVSAGGVWISLLFISISHYLIDLIKVTLLAQRNNTSRFLLDQGLHLLMLVALWLFITPNTGTLATMMWQHVTGWQYGLLALAYLLIYMPMGILIGHYLARWTPQMPHAAKADNDSLLRAGKQIGYLERTLILTFVLIGQIPAIGFLLAAKSIFRFGDLRHNEDKMRTEYVMLGTLFSFTLTIMLGLLIKALW